MRYSTSYCKPLSLTILIIILFGCSGGKEHKEIHLIKDLEIGEYSGDERYVFSMIPDIALDSNDNIYILDRMNFRILKFDTNGNYKDCIKIGKGQGPSEVTLIYSIAVTQNGKIYIFDKNTRKVIIFDNSGNFSNSFIVDFYSTFILAASSENVIILGLRKEQIFHVFSPSGKHLDSFGKPFRIPQKFAQYEGFPHIRIPLRADYSRNNRIYLVNPHKYEIKIFKDRQLKYTIDHLCEEFSPLELKVHDKKTGTVGISYPTVTVLEHKDRLYVTLKKFGENTTHTMHIFENRKYTTSLKVNGYAYAIDKKGRLYFSEEGNYPKMIRYLVSED